jgi:hypothetical protein
LQVIERGRNSVSSITLGIKGAHWLRLGTADVSILSPDHGFVRTFRDNGTVIVLQTNKNTKGRYILVTEFRVQHRKGLVVIPEGHKS